MIKNLLSLIGVTLTLVACSSNQAIPSNAKDVASPNVDVQDATPAADTSIQAPTVQ